MVMEWVTDLFYLIRIRPNCVTSRARLPIYRPFSMMNNTGAFASM